MTIIDDNAEKKSGDLSVPIPAQGSAADASVAPDVPAASHADEQEDEGDNGMLSQSNVSSDTNVPAEEVAMGGALSIGAKPKDIVITVDDKVAFIDSVVNNTRFERDYSLFGGKLKFTIRSITAEEANALATWAFKKAMADPTWHMSGRGRKHLLSAQVAKYNGMDIPPLKQPLFETLEDDGKTVKEPGWVNAASFWDNKGTAVIEALMGCIADFDLRYSTLCKKAEDENFWAPGTP